VKLLRTIHPEVKTLDEKTGLVEYVASDETLDHTAEIIKADGWRFDFFQKNAPFLDSHSNNSITCLLGKVVDFRVENRRLVETVQWALDAGEDNPLIRFGWKMTTGGFLKAVSVGFFPIKYVNRLEGTKDIGRIAADMGIPKEKADRVERIFLEQQQIELSACVIGANPSALAKAYKSGCLNDDDINDYSDLYAKRVQFSSAIKQATPELGALNDAAAPSNEGRHQQLKQKKEETQRNFLSELTRILNQI
jgi:hypothetical protein